MSSVVEVRKTIQNQEYNVAKRYCHRCDSWTEMKANFCKNCGQPLEYSPQWCSMSYLIKKSVVLELLDGLGKTANDFLLLKEPQLRKLFDASISKWGFHSQILMLVEELNELAVATLHLERELKDKGESLDHFAEEIADVEFMLEEMKYCLKNTEAIAEHRRRKEERLKEILAVRWDDAKP